MPHACPYFVEPCFEAFHFLETRFGFAAPVVEQLGRECFIWYGKGDRWVSIAYEPGSVPIVELFHPTRDLKHRRFPRHSERPARPRRLRRFRDNNDAVQQRQIAQVQAAELEALEREFLEGTGP